MGLGSDSKKKNQPFQMRNFFLHIGPVGTHQARYLHVAVIDAQIEAAAQQAFGNAGAVRFPESPAAEPWPPMRAGIGL